MKLLQLIGVAFHIFMFVAICMKYGGGLSWTWETLCFPYFVVSCIVIGCVALVGVGQSIFGDELKKK